ncbi:MAG: hypothetical protein DI628_02930 [Blastochloris viridis]|uniref:Uncharacterized protein n=1 Tax=Blastochloris viridis TaxID=1079 RepID=A0A6N4RC58_BLAVI|nr:MAG: hypothetical protein DI628_02930 [Blastochloris viridis]
MNIKKLFVLGGLFLGTLVGFNIASATSDSAEACPSACAPKRTVACADGSTISGPDNYSTADLRSRCGGSKPQIEYSESTSKKSISVGLGLTSKTTVQQKQLPPVKRQNIALNTPYCNVGSGFITWSTPALEAFGMGTMCDSGFGGNNVKAVGSSQPVRDDNGCVLRVVRNSAKQLASGSCARAVMSAYVANGELFFVTRDGAHLRLTSKYTARKVRF